MAASLGAVAAIGATVTLVDMGETTEIALVARVEGRVTGDAGLLHRARGLTSGSELYIGDEIATAEGGRLAFTVANGISLRVDAHSRVQLVDSDRVVLERGAVFVDSDPSAQRAATFKIASENATVRHIGTQYEVRTIGSQVQISVREGRVIVDAGGVLHEGKAGEQLAVDGDGDVARSTLAEHDPHWRWVHAIAPEFDIENRPLHEFLTWFSRETGRSIRFATPEIEAATRQAILRGSIAGLAPHAALEAVLATSDLALQETGDGGIVIQHRK
jgi:ferric-dicitrate binding protein FerR (iron transport regulator)